jgi:hypothetical protein
VPRPKEKWLGGLNFNAATGRFAEGTAICVFGDALRNLLRSVEPDRLCAPLDAPSSGSRIEVVAVRSEVQTI